MKLSVVIAAWSGPDALRSCLQSLCAQVRRGEDEIIVARNFPLQREEMLRMQSWTVCDLPLAPDATVPRLRSAGMAAAKGSIVAFVEDHCTCTPGWRDAIVGAHELAVAAVGGPVDLAPGGRPLDWAVFFYDYSRFAPPLKSGAVHSISGANMSYKRGFLRQSGEALRDGVMEVLLEQELQRSGASAHMAGDAIVIHAKRHSARHAIELAFALARGYASQRIRGAPAWRRFAFACATPILPLLFLGRILASTFRTHRKIGRLAMASPWLVVLLVAWSLGELAGYLAGEGESQRRWR